MDVAQIAKRLGRIISTMSVAIRAALFIALYLAITGLAAIGDSEGGANIGLGLLVFALNFLVALAWGARDGSVMPLWRVVVVWIAVALIVGVLTTAMFQMPPLGFDASVFASDLREVMPVTAGLIALPAIGAGAITAFARRVPAS